MRHPSPSSKRLALLSRRTGWSKSAQALVEFTFLAVMLVIMLFGLIDLGRAIYAYEVLANLSREGANLAARGTGSTETEILSNAAAAVINSANPLDLNVKGLVIVTAVTNNGSGGLFIRRQLSQGGITATSKVGTGAGNPVTLPATSPRIPRAGQTLYAAEVFYAYTPITPVGKVLTLALPSRLYDAAYFCGK
jgi:Flp pilus assembly protein TadG